MQGITKFLDVFRFASRCGGQCEHSEMGVLVHEFPNNLGVSVVTLALMCLVCFRCGSGQLRPTNKKDLPITRRIILLGSQRPLIRSFINVCGVI